MAEKLKPGKGQEGFKSSRNPGRSNAKPSVPDSGKPSEQYQQQGPANSWPMKKKPDSGNPGSNH